MPHLGKDYPYFNPFRSWYVADNWPRMPPTEYRYSLSSPWGGTLGPFVFAADRGVLPLPYHPGDTVIKYQKVLDGALGGAAMLEIVHRFMPYPECQEMRCNLYLDGALIGHNVDPGGNSIGTSDVLSVGAVGFGWVYDGHIPPLIYPVSNIEFVAVDWSFTPKPPSSTPF